MFSILPNCESVCVHGPGWRYCWTFDPSPRSLPPLQRSVGYNRYPTYECDAVGAILEKRGRNNKGIVIGKVASCLHNKRARCFRSPEFWSSGTFESGDCDVGPRHSKRYLVRRPRIHTVGVHFIGNPEHYVNLPAALGRPKVQSASGYRRRDNVPVPIEWRSLTSEK